MKFLGLLRKYANALKVGTMAGVVVTILWMLFMVVPTPPVNLSTNFALWTWAVVSLIFWVLCRLVVTEKAMRFIGRVVGEPHIYGRWSNPGNPEKLADRYTSLVLTDLYHSVTPTTTALLTPATFTDRISERRDLGGERGTATVSRTISGLPLLRAVPALRVEKGALVGALAVTVDGKASRTLTHAQSRGLILLAMYLLHDAVLPPSSPFMGLAIPAILADKPISEEELNALLRFIDDAESAKGISEDTRALRTMTQLATTIDFIFVVAPDGCEKPTKVAITYEESYRAHLLTFSSRLRRLFGLGRRRYVIDLHTASETPSYHLDITGPEGMYVDNPHVIHSLQGSAATTARPTRVRPEERAEFLFISSARGECGTHLYARDMDGSFAVDGKRPGTRIGLKPQFVLELLERPPGIVGPTMALALWLAVVTWVVGIYYPTVFPATTAPVSAWPAVIFGVPALVAGWLLSKLTKEVLRVISMRTFLCVAWVAVDSAFVVTLAALKTTGVSLGGFSVWFIHLHHPSWAVMMFLTAANLLACLWLFVATSTRYASTIKERASE